MARVREIDVRRQEKLSLRKCMRLVISGIHHRLLRSGLTTAVILLAVAFFMAMLSESVFIRATADGVEDEIDREREATRFLGLLTSTPGSLGQSERLAQAAGSSEAVSELAAVAGWETEDLHRLARSARQEQTFLTFFARMRMGKRLILVGKRTGRDIFEYLRDEREWRGFVEHMEPLRDLTLPGGYDQFRQFLQGYPEYLQSLSRFQQDWSDAIRRLGDAVQALTGQEALRPWLARAEPQELAQWQRLVRDAGFQLSDDKLRRVQQRLSEAQARADVVALLNRPEKREQWLKTFKESHTLDEKLERLDAPHAVSILDNRFTPDQLERVQDLYLRERRLVDLERVLSGKVETSSGSVLSGRQIFLLFISFMVCMVGIANAMLMAITERFREIATMKCLGATDGYILTQFMMEASLQGVAGGALGMAIGFALSLLKNSLVLGGYLYKFADGWVFGVFFCAIISVLLGVLLAALASLYPSWAASRMAPMEAMRIE